MTTPTCFYGPDGAHDCERKQTSRQTSTIEGFLSANPMDRAIEVVSSSQQVRKQTVAVINSANRVINELGPKFK